MKLRTQSLLTLTLLASGLSGLAARGAEVPDNGNFWLSKEEKRQLAGTKELKLYREYEATKILSQLEWEHLGAQVATGANCTAGTLGTGVAAGFIWLGNTFVTVGGLAMGYSPSQIQNTWNVTNELHVMPTYRRFMGQDSECRTAQLKEQVLADLLESKRGSTRADFAGSFADDAGARHPGSH
jgi:hypothetical protein